MNKRKAIKQIMDATEFGLTTRVVQEEWNDAERRFDLESVTYFVHMNQDFESEQRDTWKHEIERLTAFFFHEKYEMELHYKFSGLVGEIKGIRSNLWRANCSYLIWGGEWSFESSQIIPADSVVQRIKSCYERAWYALLWCEKHQCFSNLADRDGYLYCQECDWEEADGLNED